MLTPQTATRTHGDYTVTKYATPDGYRYVVFHLGERVAVCASYDEAREVGRRQRQAAKQPQFDAAACRSVP